MNLLGFTHGEKFSLSMVQTRGTWWELANARKEPFGDRHEDKSNMYALSA